MTILVAGATGTVGRQLVKQLVQAKANFPAQVEVIEGDLTRPASWAAALEGVVGLHLINFGGDDYAPLQTGAEIVRLATKARVKRVTVLRGGANMARWKTP